MISLTDIVNSVTSLLKANIKDITIYNESNRTEPKSPALYVIVRPLEIKTFKHHVNYLVNVSVQYISVNNTKSENLIMVEKLQGVFQNVLNVKNRALTIDSISVADVENLLTLTITLDYNNSSITKPSEEILEKMSDLHINKGEI